MSLLAYAIIGILSAIIGSLCVALHCLKKEIREKDFIIACHKSDIELYEQVVKQLRK